MNRMNGLMKNQFLQYKEPELEFYDYEGEWDSTKEEERIIEELDKIRKEIKKKAFLRNHDYHCHPTYSVDLEDIEFIILNHIKELEEKI